MTPHLSEKRRPRDGAHVTASPLGLPQIDLLLKALGNRRGAAFAVGVAVNVEEFGAGVTGELVGIAVELDFLSDRLCASLEAGIKRRVGRGCEI